MNRIIINACMLGLGVLTLASCSDAMDEITSLVVGRDFSPTNFEAKSIKQESAQLQWSESKGAASYNLEIFENDSLKFDENNKIQSFQGITADQIPYAIEGLVYDTKYSARVMAIDANDESRNSVWNGVYFRTSAQQIFKNVDALQDVVDTKVTMHWPAGEENVTKLVAKYTDDNGKVSVVSTHELTAEEKEAGAATIDGLQASTKYTIYLYYVENGEAKERGNKTITTIADLAGATIVEEGDNLKELLANATDGQVFALKPGTYKLLASSEDENVTSSVKLEHNVVIKGIYPTAKPVIMGRFEINGAKSLEIDNVVLDGSANNSTDQAFNFKEAATDLEKLVVTNSEIKDYGKGLFYLNVAAAIKNITFNSCDVQDVCYADGAEMMDCRKGRIDALNIKNSTFYYTKANPVARHFIRIDDVANTMGGSTEIVVDHCLLNGISNGASKKCLLYVRYAGNKITWSNNIVSNTQATWTYASGTNEPTFTNNVYFNCSQLNTKNWDSELNSGLNKFVDTSAKVLDPQYADVAKGDFTIGNESVSKLEVGPSKWYAE